MSYEVVWERPACFNEIDALMAAGMPAETIRQVVKNIAEELQIDPQNKGVGLAEGLRRLDAPPFCAYFYLEGSRVTVSLLHFQPNR
jgi:hypothetical protein